MKNIRDISMEELERLYANNDSFREFFLNDTIASCKFNFELWIDDIKEFSTLEIEFINEGICLKEIKFSDVLKKDRLSAIMTVLRFNEDLINLDCSYLNLLTTIFSQEPTSIEIEKLKDQAWIDFLVRIKDGLNREWAKATLNPVLWNDSFVDRNDYLFYDMDGNVYREL